MITKCKFSELGDHCPPYLYSTKTLLSFVRLFWRGIFHSTSPFSHPNCHPKYIKATHVTHGWGCRGSLVSLVRAGWCVQASRHSPGTVRLAGRKAGQPSWGTDPGMVGPVLADFPDVVFHITPWFLSWNTSDKSLLPVEEVTQAGLVQGHHSTCRIIHE